MRIGNPKSACPMLSILLLALANPNVQGLADINRLYAEERNSGVETTVESRTVSVRINRPLQMVYEFLANPGNWNEWAHGLGKSIRRLQGRWIADTQEGTIEVRFTPMNKFGVVDHYIRRKSGMETYVPLRLISNGRGCELLFTLFREPGMSDETYAADLEFVKQDLDGLKGILEK
jgi:hypothetical protein